MDLAAVLKQPLVVPSSPHGLRTIVYARPAQMGTQPDIRLETNDASLQRPLTAQGVGRTVLPAIAAMGTPMPIRSPWP